MQREGSCDRSVTSRDGRGGGGSPRSVTGERYGESTTESAGFVQRFEAQEALVAPTPDDIDVSALIARAEADADAARGRAEVDARAALAAAEAEAAAVRGRAEVDARATLAAAAADRDEARRLLEVARRRAEEMLLEAAEVQRRTEQVTLDRLLATRADLHDAIERLTEMTDPVLDLTDGGLHLAEVASDPDPRVVPLGAVIDRPDDADPERSSSDPGATGDAVDDLVRAAIERAVDSAATPGRTQAFATEQPARWREQLRDGRNIL
jgi:hypothetical protein